MQPLQNSMAGGLNSNLGNQGKEKEAPLGEQFPDPATHDDDPRWGTKDSTKTGGAPPPTDPQPNPAKSAHAAKGHSL